MFQPGNVFFQTTVSLLLLRQSVKIIRGLRVSSDVLIKEGDDL